MIEFDINGIKLYGFHGLYERERELGQFFKIDISYIMKKGKPYPDYTEVIKNATDVFLEHKYHYLEDVADAVCDKILSLFHVESVKIRVTKLHPPLNIDVENVSCTVEKRK